MNDCDLKNYIGLLNGATLKPLLSGYKRVNDKISEMIKGEDLIHLERGKYLSREAWESGKVLKYSIANALYGPSYISGYTALSYHGMIPERVNTIESATTLRSKDITTGIGQFVYQKVDASTFHIGINYINTGDNGFLIANSAKAIIDVIWMMNVSEITSMNAMETFLFDHIRLDEYAFLCIDDKTLLTCMDLGKNKRQLKYLSKILIKYRSGTA